MTIKNINYYDEFVKEKLYTKLLEFRSNYYFMLTIYYRMKQQEWDVHTAEYITELLLTLQQK